VVYIETPDIEQTLRQVENLGGKTVVAKTLIMPEEGYYGRFSDPSGNVLGLWSKT